MTRVWLAAHVWREGEPIRYTFYSTEETEQFMHGPVPKSATVVLKPEDALDLAWSLFEDVAKVAPHLPGPVVERRHYDLLEQAIKNMAGLVEKAAEQLPAALKTKEREFQSLVRAWDDRRAQLKQGADHGR